MSGEQANFIWNERTSTPGDLYDKTLSSRGTKRKETDRNEEREKRAKVHPSELEQIDEMDHGKDSKPQEEELRLTEKDLKKLHDAIKSGKIYEVKEFIRKFPYEKIACYNGKSAMLKSCRHFLRNIFDLLLLHNFRLRPNENHEKNLKKYGLQALKFNLKNVAIAGQYYLIKLIHKCSITRNCQNNPKKNDFFELIWQALQNLNEIPEVRILLKILASCSDLHIAFDFESGHIAIIDPRKDEYVQGCFHRSINWITIGAKNLLDPKLFQEVYGTMAHEFCHCAMEKIFRNDCKPYFKEEYEKLKTYETVIDDCEKNKKQNEIIDNAFKYDKNMLHAELIVRVPHMLAAYQQNKNLLNEVRNKFKLLFDFFEDIIVFMNKKVVELRSIDARENANKGVLTDLQNSGFTPNASVLNEFQFDFGARTTQIIQSNCIKFTMKLLYEKLRIDENLDSFIFTNQEIFDVKDVLEACVEAVEWNRNTKLIIACEIIDLKRILELREHFFLRDDFIIIANKLLPYSEEHAIQFHNESNKLYKLSDLSEDSPIFEKEVNFQGIKIFLKRFMRECREIIDYYPIKDVLENDSLNVGKDVIFTERYVIRKYYSPSSQHPLGHGKLTYEDIANKAKLGKVILLSDAPGNGKTTEFQYLAGRLKKKFPFQWVLYIDLRKHVKSFEKQKLLEMFNSSLQIAEFFASKILKLESYEAEIFIAFFISDRAVILLDGYDEVSPTFKQFMTKLVVAIKEKTKNQLWISTRPQFESELKTKLNAEVFRILGFNEADRKVFLEHFFNNKEVSNLDFDTIHEKIEKLLTRIDHSNEFWRENTIYNPLFLKIIAEVVSENYENDESYDNMYKLYEKFVKKILEEPIQNISEILIGDINIISYHRKSALELLWSDKNNKKSIPLICDDTGPISPKKYRAGLMYHDGSDFYFIHQTIAEFFAAQVICENLFKIKILSNKKFEALKKLFRFVINEKHCKVIRMFIDMFLKDCKVNYKRLKISKITEIDIDYFNLDEITDEGLCNLFDFISFNMVKNWKVMQEIWLRRDDALSLFKFLSSESIKLYFKSFEDNAIKQILMKQYLQGFNCLMAAAQNKNEDVLKLFLNYATAKLSSEEFSTLLKYPKINPKNNTYNIDAILNRLSTNLNQMQMEKFLKMNMVNENFINDLIKRSKKETVEWFITKVYETKGETYVKNILTKKFKNPCFHDNPLILAARENEGDIIIYLLDLFKDEELKDVLNQCDSKNKNFLEFSNEWNLKGLLYFYVKIFGIEHMKTMIVPYFKSHLDLKFVKKFKVIWKFMSDNFELNDLFNIIIEFPDDFKKRNFFKFCFPEIKKICDKFTYSQALDLLHKVMNSPTFDMVQKLSLCITLNELSEEPAYAFMELTQFLVKSFQNLISYNEKYKIILNNRKLKHDLFVLLLDTYSNHYEKNYFFDEVNDDDENIHQIVISEKIKHIFGSNILKLLLLYYFDSKSILMHLGVKKHDKTLKVILITIEKHLKPIQIHEILLKTDSGNNSILMNSWFWEKCEEYLLKIFKKEGMKEYLYKMDETGRSIYWYATNNCLSSNLFKLLTIDDTASNKRVKQKMENVEK